MQNLDQIWVQFNRLCLTWIHPLSSHRLDVVCCGIAPGADRHGVPIPQAARVHVVHIAVAARGLVVSPEGLIEYVFIE